MWTTMYSARFHDIDKNNSVFKHVKKMIEDSQLIVAQENDKLLITAPNAIYYQEAEYQELMKMNRKTKILEEFSCANKEDFDSWDKPQFFAPSEQAFMLNEILERISPDESFIEILQKATSEKVLYKIIMFFN